MSTSSTYRNNQGPCAACNYPLRLGGTGFSNGYQTAVLAAFCVAALFYLICVPMSVFYSRWRRIRGITGRLGSPLFGITALFLLFSSILSISYFVLMGTNRTVTYAYYITFIFDNFFGLIGHILIIVIVSNYVQDGLVNSQRKFKTGMNVVIVLLTLLFLAYLSMDIAQTVYLLSNRSRTLILTNINQVLLTTYAALWLVAILALMFIYARTSRSQGAHSKSLVAAFFFLLALALLAVASDATVLWINKATVLAYRRADLERALEFVNVAAIITIVFQAVALFCLAIHARSGSMARPAQVGTGLA